MSWLPETKEQLNSWSLWLTFGYLGSVYLVNLCTIGSVWHLREKLVPVIFDAVVFSASITLAMGVWEPKVLALIGDLQTHLTIASAAGLGYCGHAIWPKKTRAGRRATDITGTDE